MLIDGRIFCWNCRGARSGEFIKEMKEFKRMYKPMIIILIEPKINGAGADGVCKKIGKINWIHSEATRISRGVCLLWDEVEVRINLKYAHKSFLHVEATSSGGRRLDLTAVYASSNASI